jgi:transposase
MLLWVHPLMKLFVLIVSPSVSFLFEITIKEEFTKIYETSENPTEGLLSISEWLAKSSSVFTKSCQTIRNWFGEIISYFERRTTNGVVEGINNQQ